ncbi:MAG: type IV pilin protein [Candidatus Hydrogenedentota bacterium]
MKKLHKSQGFTLIELMIVVAIIAIIAAIAIPNLLRSRIQSNESAAVGNLRTVVGAQTAYHASEFEYAVDFATLTGATPPFLDGEWDGVPKNGYNFALGGSSQSFTCNADPVESGVTGNKGFFTDASGVIRHADGGAADETSPVLGQDAP